jgi:fumarate reductase (CoM/CoB) subunit A
MELSTRDITARAIVSEILDGRGSPHGGVYLDVSYLGNNIIENYVAEVFPNFSFRGYSLLEAGLDIRKDAMEVAPMAHFTMGGVRINTKCETNIAGLYAAGEVAGGLHGANRCEGNALPETQTFGAIAGREASGYVETAKDSKPTEGFVAEAMKRVLDITKRGKGIQHFEIRKRVQETMWKQVGVVRTTAGLAAAVKEFDRIKHEDLPRLMVKHQGHGYNRELFEALETLNMVEVGEVMARSAALRRESRGAHYLRDLPERDDENWLVNAIAHQKAGKVVIRHEPAVITKFRPKGGKAKWVDQDE